MDIVVLAGGVSVEREVSLSSGTKICKALRDRGHRAVVIDLFFGLGDLPKDVKDLFRLAKDPEPFQVKEHAPDIAAVRKSRGDVGLGDIGPNVLTACRAADMVFMGLHGEDGENGRLQAVFDMVGVRYTGSGYLGSALAMNKWVTKQLFLQAGITTPKSMPLSRADGLEAALTLGLPCVVKPCSGGSSVGVSIAGTQEELERALEETFRYEETALLEEYIEGREFSVGVLGDMALPPIEIIPRSGFYDYAHKYQPGWTEEICPGRTTPEETSLLQAAAKKAFELLKLSVYGRADFLISADGKAYCLEVNTLPGMTPTSLLPQEAQAAGIDYPSLCERVIALSMEKYR